jgi:hypothetical protein
MTDSTTLHIAVQQRSVVQVKWSVARENCDEKVTRTRESKACLMAIELMLAEAHEKVITLQISQRQLFEHFLFCRIVGA